MARKQEHFPQKSVSVASDDECETIRKRPGAEQRSEQEAASLSAAAIIPPAPTRQLALFMVSGGGGGPRLQGAAADVDVT